MGKSREQNEKGAAVVEAAAVSLLFFIVLTAVVDISRLGHTWLTLHFATQRAVRWATLGETLLDSNGVPLNRVESVKQRVLEEAGQLGVAVTKNDIRVCSATAGPGCFVESIGTRDEFFFVTTSATPQALVAVPSVVVNTHVVGKNE